jgi:hypothetical protein
MIFLPLLKANLEITNLAVLCKNFILYLSNDKAMLGQCFKLKRDREDDGSKFDF